MASVSSIPIANPNQQAALTQTDDIRSSFTSKVTNNTAPSINSIIKHAQELGIDMSYKEAQLIAAGVSESNNNVNGGEQQQEEGEEEESESIALNSIVDNSTLDTNLTPFNTTNYAHHQPPTRRGSTGGFNISALTLDTNMDDPLTPQSAIGGKQHINVATVHQSDLPFGAQRRGSIEEENRLDTHLETTQESTQGQSATSSSNTATEPVIDTQSEEESRNNAVREMTALLSLSPIDTQSEVALSSAYNIRKNRVTGSDVNSLPNFYPRDDDDSSIASSTYSKVNSRVSSSVMSRYSHCSSASCVSRDDYSVASQSYYTIKSQYSKVSKGGSRQSSVRRRREMYNSTLNEADLKEEDKSEATTNKEEDNNVALLGRSEPLLSVANSEETPSGAESYEKTIGESYERSDTDLLLNEAANVLKEKIRRLSGDKLSSAGMDYQQQHGKGGQIVLCQEIQPITTSLASLATTNNDHGDGQSEAASTNYYEGTQAEESLDIEDEDLNNSKALVLLDQSSNQSYGQSGVTDESPTSVTDTASLDNDTVSNHHQHSQALVLHSSEQPPQQQSRGIEPTEIIHNKAFLHIDGPNDPPGESPNDCPVVCMDIVPHTTNNNSRGRGWEATDAPSAYSGHSNDSGRSSDPGGSYHSGDSGIGGRRRWSNVTWVDPKTIQDENDIDYNVLRQYETLTGCGSREDSGSSGSYKGGEESRALVVAVDPPSTTTTEYSSTTTSSSSTTPSILSNPRTRIATISSGYKKANYFVREDLDTRIYFHQIEDAIGYMAKRGYCKMRGEEEKEWKMLLGKAHGVIKGGAKKKAKQRYRKGKLVMILKKTITDTPAAADSYVDTVTKPKKKKTKKKKKTRSSSSTMSSSQDTQSTSTERSSSLYSSQSTDTSVQTSRTSLGKTIRGTYKSYSEKFLAQQEEEKQRCLLAIMEGVPADELNVYGNDNVVGKQLLLTDGSDHYDGPVDAPSEYGDETTTSGASTYNSKDDFEKSRHTVASNRRGVYGGGVQYFTPDSGKYDDDESESEDEGTEEVCYEDSEEEEDAEEEEDVEEEYTSQDEYEEDDTEGGGESDTIELEGSDMDSMFSTEDTYAHHQHSVGVESISGADSISDSTMSTAEQNERHYSGGKSGSSGKRRGGGKGRGPPPPKMTTISDNSVSTSNS